MKKFFVYFDKKVIINSAEEAEEFINSLTDKNEPDGRKLEVNDNVHSLLKKIYQDEQAGRKLQTTGCSPSSFIYCYPALADTTEECEKAIIAKEEADRKRKQDEEIQEKQRIAREINERRKKLAAMPKGFFTVCLYATVNFSYKYYEYEVYAENGEEAYKMAVAKLKKDFGAHLWDYDSILDAEIIPRLLGNDIYSL
jgi:hypothetical protein